MGVTLGTAPDSWGVWATEDDTQISWDRFLDEVAEAGYKWIETGPYGYLPTDITTLNLELERRGLKIPAVTIMVGHLDQVSDRQKIEDSVMAAGVLGAAVGAKYLVLIDDTYRDLNTGESVAPTHLDESGWQCLIDTTHRVADIASEKLGLRTVFHPHAETHIQYENEIEMFLEQTDPSRVSLCFDTGHHVYAGGDPVSFMRKHHDRISYIHLKSVDRHILNQVKVEDIPMVTATEMGVFCEPSDGAVDFVALSALLTEIQYDGWAIVEQDMRAPAPRVSVNIAKRTRIYLEELGIG